MTMAMIYCVEDDANIRELIEYTLTSADFSVRSFESGRDFFAALKNARPDLVLLDIMLPDIDGLEILQTLRHSGDTAVLPVIMLTARSLQMDKIKGLDSGADDYITKPFDVLELLSRVRAVLRRSGNAPAASSEIQYKEIAMNHNKHMVTVAGNAIILTFKEYELLGMLLTNLGSVVPRERIVAEVWGTDYEGESRTLDVHIRSLRRKLGAAGDYIETVRGVGYKIG